MHSGYVFIDKERYVFDSFNECFCRKHWLIMKLTTVIKSSWEADIGWRKYIWSRQVAVGIVLKSEFYIP